MYRYFLKRVIDCVVALLALVLLGPFMLVIAASIKLGSQGPVLYKGPRVGMLGRMFPMLKFRTMIVGADAKGPSSTASDDSRITGIGKWLRRLKLDELPQLINVLVGHMSLVGPRPQVKWAVDSYSDEERRLLTVRPGVTDWASLRFSNEGELLKGSLDPDRDYMVKIHPEKVALGLRYVDSVSFATDVRIVLQTAAAVLGVRSTE